MSDEPFEKDEESKSDLSSESKQELLAEFVALREELIKRQEMRFQLLTFTLIIAGTILSLGTQKEVSVIVLLIYPILAFFLALTLVHIQIGAVEISQYLKEKIEDRFLSLGWERYIRELQTGKRKSYFAKAKGIPAFGVFIVTEIVALVLAVPRIFFPFKESLGSILEVFLFTVSIVAIILTCYIFRHRVTQRHLMNW